MAKKTTAKKTTAKNPASAPKKSTPKKDLVEAIFLDRKSKKLLVRGKYPASIVANNPTTYFKDVIDAQSNAKHFLDEIQHELKEGEYAEIKFLIEQFS